MLHSHKSEEMKACISDLVHDQIAGKDVFLRVELNVPLKCSDKTDEIIVENTARIRNAVPTIQHLIHRGARCVGLFAHLGRPQGKVNKNLSLKPVANALAKLLETEVHFVEDCIGQAVEAAVKTVEAQGAFNFQSDIFCNL